jgi:hypothetical protein
MLPLLRSTAANVFPLQRPPVQTLRVFNIGLIYLYQGIDHSGEGNRY